ncbi:hypothetical protein [Bacillus massiliigorillae]|uniref:hypothetical protein n=1 Tax=Bacillus massiliigorillae TaxID=1243664 RepID=UPI0003A4216A|nr:hypothetical protein [Bacillus massiliigorillae]
MAGKETRLTLWALDPELSLENVITLLKLNYSKTIDYLSNRNDIPRYDRTLVNSWKPFSDDEEEFKIQTYTILGQEIKCIPTKSFIETSAPEGEVIYNDYVIPRSKRIHQNIQNVFFFESFGRVFVIVEGPEYKIRSIRSVLMGAGRKADEAHKEWKKVQFKDIPNYSFSSDFFYWLISKENQEVSSCNEERCCEKEECDSLLKISISDIRNLSQSVDRKDITHESTGKNLLDEAVPKTGLGINTTVGQVGTTLITSEGTIRFHLLANGEAIINNYESGLNGTNGEVIPFYLNLDLGSLMLYAVLLPELKKQFNIEKNGPEWTIEHQALARKSWALGAINELCAENEIDIDEIEALDWFK